MTRAGTRRVKRGSLIIGAVAVVSFMALSFEIDDDESATDLAKASGAPATAAPAVEAA